MSIGISFVLTLVIFSYLLADNFLYRMAVSVFVGLAAAFTTIVTVESVILPAFLRIADIGISQDFRIFYFTVFIIAVSLTVMLLLRPIPQLRWITNIGIGYLIAVGSAAALAGAITGTLIPLTFDVANVDTTNTVTIINSVVIIIGVITSLLYFQYMTGRNIDGDPQRTPIIRLLAGIGEGFIVVTLGALYAAAILTSLTVLTGQLSSLFAG